MSRILLISYNVGWISAFGRKANTRVIISQNNFFLESQTFCSNARKPKELINIGVILDPVGFEEYKYHWSQYRKEEYLNISV